MRHLELAEGISRFSGVATTLRGVFVFILNKEVLSSFLVTSGKAAKATFLMVQKRHFSWFFKTVGELSFKALLVLFSSE